MVEYIKKLIKTTLNLFKQKESLISVEPITTASNYINTNSISDKPKTNKPIKCPSKTGPVEPKINQIKRSYQFRVRATYNK